MKKSISLFLCLVCCVSFTACARPAATTEPKPVETEKIITPPVQKAALTKTQNTASNKESKPMIDIDNPPRGPAIPAAELKKQILALISSLQSREDMSREHVEKHMGLVLQPHPHANDIFIYFGQVTEGWAYNLATTYTYGDPVPSIEIGFINKEEVSDDALPKTCTLDFEDLSKEIVALGYERGERPFRRRWGFGKDIPLHSAGIGIGVEVYSAENGTDNGVDCVKSIRIGSGALNE
jgi:hypothetical protein